MNRGKAAGKRCRKSDIYIPIILLMPAFLLVVGVIIYPICYAVGLSFQYYKLTDYVNRQFIGLENYISVWRNETFLASLGNTVKWVGITVACQFLFGLVLAMILNVPFRGRGIIRSITLMPWVTPGVVIALMWVWIYNGNFGVLRHHKQKHPLAGVFPDGAVQPDCNYDMAGNSLLCHYDTGSTADHIRRPV